tara:strand:+ start:985 stop:2160 length:1176 start_codon:yes stop_codon:yes gene_type:complete
MEPASLSEADSRALAQVPADNQAQVLQIFQRRKATQAAAQQKDLQLVEYINKTRSTKRQRVSDADESVARDLQASVSGKPFTAAWVPKDPRARNFDLLKDQFSSRAEDQISRDYVKAAQTALQPIFLNPQPNTYFPMLMTLVAMNNSLHTRYTGAAVYTACRDKNGEDTDLWADSYRHNIDNDCPKYFGVPASDADVIQQFTLTLAKYISIAKITNQFYPHSNKGQNDYKAYKASVVSAVNFIDPSATGSLTIGTDTPFRYFVEDIANDMITTTQFELHGFPQGVVVLHAVKHIMHDKWDKANFDFPNASYKMFRAFFIMAKERFKSTLQGVEVVSEDFTSRYEDPGIAADIQTFMAIQAAGDNADVAMEETQLQPTATPMSGLQLRLRLT